jgi:hypothetical protein
MRTPLFTALFTLLALSTGLQLAHAEPARTPAQLIEHLGVEMRQILADPKSRRAPEEAERAVADEILARSRSSPQGHAPLAEADGQGRTPLMLAVGGAYPLIVKALLADPGVKQQVNARDAAGETAWMVASFAPSMTLPACQPGLLTLERYLLLPPYVRRMAALLDGKPSPLAAIVQALEDAGAVPDPAGARQAWLARCPNATPELRRALATGALLPTLVNESIGRQTAFAKAYLAGLTTISQKPPEGMRFIAPRPGQPPLLRTRDMTCAHLAPPVLHGTLDWSGSLQFRLSIATRAGIVEAVDIDVSPPATDADARVADYFRGVILKAVAAYQCEGDHIFEQEFRLKIE